MVDVTDAAFRSLAIAWGADVTCSEMISAAGLVHGNQGAWNHVRPWPGEKPYGIQFMTGDPEEMAAAVRQVAPIKPDYVDINLGCPAPNILKVCAGGFLLRDPKKAGAVMRVARAAADEVGIKSVSCKLRTGPSSDKDTYLEIGRQAEAAGLDWMVLHGRSVEQGYSGSADWTAIGRLTAAMSIPVIGNGDLRTPEDVVRMRDETGCAGFFIARAAMHDPTIFRRMRQALNGQTVDEPPTLAARTALAREYLRRAVQVDIVNVADLRRQVSRFMAGAPGAKQLRVTMQHARTREELESALDSALESACS